MKGTLISRSLRCEEEEDDRTEDLKMSRDQTGEKSSRDGGAYEPDMMVKLNEPMIRVAMIEQIGW